MTEDRDKNKQMFLSLVYSFQMQTMMQMGKIANPMTQKVERELEAAQVTIDMLDMLKEKSKGNLEEDESKFLDQVIADLKLNFVEESGKSEDAPKVTPEEISKETPLSEAKSESAPVEKNTETTADDSKSDTEQKINGASKSESEPSDK